MYKLKSSKTVYRNKWMVVLEDSVIDEELGIVGIFNRINVDDAELQDQYLKTDPY